MFVMLCFVMFMIHYVMFVMVLDVILMFIYVYVLV